MWKQSVDPLGNLALSAGAAVLPIAFLFWALAIRRVKGHWAALGALGAAFAVAVAVFRMPVGLAALSSLHGACYGIFPIGWIVFCAVMLHTVIERTGQLDALKQSIATLTTDKRIQAVLVAFCFGALIEACAGFGAPVAISAGILAGLGVPVMEAAELCLVANTAPVAFGAIGIPILMASNVSGIDPLAISKMVGRQLPLLSVIVPFYVVGIMSGAKGIRETWPAALVAGVSFGVTQWWTSNYLGPTLPDILSALVSMAAVALWLAVRKRRTTPDAAALHHRPLFAWAPFLIVSTLMIVWALPSVKALLDIATFKAPVWGLHNAIESASTGKPIAAEYTINALSAAGTALFAACSIAALTQGVAPGGLWHIYLDTFVKLKYALLTVAALLAYAYLGNASGMTVTLGTAIAHTGAFFPLFAPLLGWLGVFITGSDTSSNAIFGKLQAISAEKVGMNPVLAVASNASGGVAGKMVSPQSIAVATAATGLSGQEAALFRRTIKHSLALVAVVMVLTYAQANVLSWMVPAATTAATMATASTNRLHAALWLAGGTVVAFGFAVAARDTKRKNEDNL